MHQKPPFQRAHWVAASCALVFLSAATGQDLPTPKAYYDFEGPIGATVADKSGDMRDATLSGTVVASPGAPMGSTPGSGFIFADDGSNCLELDYLVEDLLNVDGGYTMTAWIQPSKVNGQHILFGQASQGIHLGIRNGSVLHQAHWNDDHNAGTALVEGEWVHAAWVYDRTAGEGRMYLNGVEDAIHGQGDPNLTDQPLIVGNRDGCGGGEGFGGVADDVTIWSQVLTEDQVFTLAKGASPIGVESGDTDNDGLPDRYEITLAGNLTDLNGTGDFDGDGRKDLEEFSVPPATNPTKADTDGDTLLDGEELTGVGNRPATRPTAFDTDGDGLSDAVEDNTGTFVSALQTGTDPTKRNTDGVGGTDGSEVAVGTNPLDPNDPAPNGPFRLPQPRLYYTFETENEGIIPDNAGEGFDGTIMAGELTGGAPDGPSPIGGFSFPDEGGCIMSELNIEDLITRASGYTMTAWLRPADVSDQHILFGQTNQGIHNGIRNGSVLHQAHWSDDHNAGTAVVEDEWAHAAWVFDNEDGMGRIYLNGQLDAEHAIGLPNQLNAELILGNRSGCGGEGPFRGDIDEVAVWSEPLTAEQILALAEGANPLGRSGPAIAFTNITLQTDSTVAFTWVASPGGYYAVDTSVDLINWESLAIEFPEGGAIGSLASYTDARSLAEQPAAFYRVSQVPPPPLLREDFENGANGWTTVTDAGETLWELGTPNVAGLTAAHSGTQAWGTNLAGNYSPATNAARLRSPLIDLTTRSSPTLSFHYFIDAIEGEGGQIRFIDEAENILATAPELPDIFTGKTEGWQEHSVRIPSEARGRPIYIEFAFLSDGDEVTAAGWYIDDVTLD